FGDNIPQDMDKVCGLVLTIESERKRSFEDDKPESMSRSVRAKVSSPQVCNKEWTAFSRHTNERNGNILNTNVNEQKPCTYCGKVWHSGHRCAEFLVAKGKKAKSNFVSRAARMTQVHHKYDVNNPLSYEYEGTPSDVDGDDIMQKIDLEAL
ncbi:hypothetical protein DFQ30_005701, partial [Apophysomyces sp. BC1015]